MKKAAVVLVALVIVMLVVPAAFAQGGAPEQKLPQSHDAGPGRRFRRSHRRVRCGLGQGRIAAAACEGIARNPGATDGVRAP